MDVMKLTDIVRETSFAIHKYHGNGYLEKIYENALVHRLRKSDLKAEQQYPLKVYDEDRTILGEYFTDVFLEDYVIIEIKACKTIAEEHKAQLFGYLKSSGMKHGILINFGVPKLQIKKYIFDPNWRSSDNGGEQ